MARKTQVAILGLAVALLVLAVSGLFLERREEAGEGLLVVLLTPGFEDEVRSLLAEGDRLYVIGSGGDPHEIQLSPSEMEILRKANLIISMGHTSIDKRVEELQRRGEVKAVILNLVEIPGLIIPELPEDGHAHDNGHGVENYHEPFYDPRNAIVILGRIVDLLVELRPDMRDVYIGKYRELKTKLDDLVRVYEGALKGYKAVISTAEIQPAITWLGVEVVAYIVVDQHESPSPQTLEKAVRKLDEEGVIAFIAVICNGGCELASQVDRMLLEEAKARGVHVVEIPLGYTGTSVISKLEYLIHKIPYARGS
ncbi:MAG: metal ABC transporter solute-binding protein, Zn/Mn family [Acidilobaceae archaeon]|jgi:zinc/manganese transport system substrate-binding protein